MVVWPSELPTGSILQDVTRGIGDARIRAQMDAGSKMRRRLSFVPEPVTLSFVMTVAQRERFERFINIDLKGGVLPFRMPRQDGPRGKATGEWICQIGQSMPQWRWQSEDSWIVTLDLVRLPQ